MLAWPHARKFCIHGFVFFSQLFSNSWSQLSKPPCCEHQQISACFISRERADLCSSGVLAVHNTLAPGGPTGPTHTPQVPAPLVLQEEAQCLRRAFNSRFAEMCLAREKAADGLEERRARILEIQKVSGACMLGRPCREATHMGRLWAVGSEG